MRLEDMTTKEKKEAVLRFLYDRKDENSFIEVGNITKDHPLITSGDVSIIVDSLDRQNYISKQSSVRPPHARISAKGAEYVEALAVSENFLSQYKPADKISPGEQEFLRDKVNELLERLKRLELGQQVIYDDLEEELQRLKELVGVLRKKDWKQMLLGKLIDAGLGSVAGEVMKTITATFHDQNLLH